MPGKAALAKRVTEQGSFVPRTPPKPGFSIRAFVERNQLQEKCPVCLETSSRTEFMTLGCNHRFHGHCLETMLRNGQRSCPLCRANINNSWLEREEMVDFFISDVVDELIDDRSFDEYWGDEYWGDDEYNRYGSEYYGSTLYSGDFNGLMHIIDSDYEANYLAPLIAAELILQPNIAEHRRIDVFELDNLGLVRLFQNE